MNWYVAPIYKKPEEKDFSYVIGHILNGEVFDFSCSNYICQAHNPKHEPQYVLIGLKEPMEDIPGGWISKNLDEAREYFYNIYNREATDKEIY